MLEMLIVYLFECNRNGKAIARLEHIMAYLVPSGCGPRHHCCSNAGGIDARSASRLAIAKTINARIGFHNLKTSDSKYMFLTARTS